MTKIEEVSISVTKRLLREPFTTALRTVSGFDVIECFVKTADGRIGRGECVETPVITGDTAVQILHDLNGPLRAFLLSGRYSTYLEMAPDLASIEVTASARAAVDMAIYDLEHPLRDVKIRVRSDVTVPISPYEEIESLTRARMDAGFSVLKIKLANEEIDSSIAKLIKIRELTGPDWQIRVDPNQSWSVGHTIDFLESADKSNLIIDFLEQPTPAKDKLALAAIRKRTNVKIMADESCYNMKDVVELIALEAVDLINIKLLKSGGLYSSFEMAKVARDAGIEAFVGSMMEGDLGVAYAARLAHQISPLAVHDLDAAWWAKESVLRYEDGLVVI